VHPSSRRLYDRPHQRQTRARAGNRRVLGLTRSDERLKATCLSTIIIPSRLTASARGVNQLPSEKTEDFLLVVLFPVAHSACDLGDESLCMPPATGRASQTAAAPIAPPGMPSARLPHDM